MALDNETISTLTEAIANVYESDLTELVLKRLDSFGYMVSEDDAFNCFYSSNIIFHDGFIYWVGEDVETVLDIEDYLTYFKARSLKRKMINKNNNE